MHSATYLAHVTNLRAEILVEQLLSIRKAFLSGLVLNLCEDGSELSPALGGEGGIALLSLLVTVKLGGPVMQPFQGDL